jgi:hypothetical protein
MKINVNKLLLSSVMIFVFLFSKSIDAVSVSESLKYFNQANYESALKTWIQVINEEGNIDIETVLAVALNVILVNKASNANDDNEKISEAYFAAYTYMNKQYRFQKAVISGDINRVILYIKTGDIDINDRLVEIYRKANLENAANLINSVRIIDEVNYHKITYKEYGNSMLSLLKLPNDQKEIIKKIFIKNKIDNVENKNKEYYYVSQLCELLLDNNVDIKERDEVLDLIRVIDSKLKLLRIVDINNVKMSNYKYETIALIRIYSQNHQDDIDSIKSIFEIIFSKNIDDVNNGNKILEEYLLKIKAPFTRDVRREFIKVYYGLKLINKDVNIQATKNNQMLKADILASENNYSAASDIYKQIFISGSIDAFVKEDAWIGLLQTDPKFAIENSDLIINNIKSANEEIYLKHVFWLGRQLSINAFLPKKQFEIAAMTELNEKYLDIIDTLLTANEIECLSSTKINNGSDLRYSFSAIYAFSNKPEKASELLLRELTVTYQPPTGGWKGDFGEPVKDANKPREILYPQISQLQQDILKLLNIVSDSSRANELLPRLAKAITAGLIVKINKSIDEKKSTIYFELLMKCFEKLVKNSDSLSSLKDEPKIENVEILQSIIEEINVTKKNNIDFCIINEQLLNLIFSTKNITLREILFKDLLSGIENYKKVDIQKVNEQINSILAKIDRMNPDEFKLYGQRLRDKLIK